MKYKYLPHTADIKFQAFGKDLEECFTNAAYALVNIITKSKVKSVEKRKIRIKARDRERLLYNFLEEFLYLLDVEDFLLAKINKIQIKSNIKRKNPLRYELELIVEIVGDKSKNYKTEGDVKAITYNSMEIKQDNKEVRCQVVVDV